MIDYDRINSLLNDVDSLPISEEMLGAYIEGNLDGADLRDMQNLLNTDLTLSDIEKEVVMSMFYIDDPQDLSHSICVCDEALNPLLEMMNSPFDNVELPTIASVPDSDLSFPNDTICEICSNDDIHINNNDMNVDNGLFSMNEDNSNIL